MYTISGEEITEVYNKVLEEVVSSSTEQGSEWVFQDLPEDFWVTLQKLLLWIDYSCKICHPSKGG